ncbi:hypothetical protein F4556_006772 [Kitasatospora gansuensis]|uniref:DUF4328 domain-containing protein n=1 Tax=Kitasatospora gansuensis TaxID=258050 RepID=A0A7W7WKW1_9ACTN|nr:DUF4328 domain-containing protein [Kitasatospora gansuensis]MBB4951237.1 hypothetical protein [Kitasatospora gansuensis]
MYPDPLTNPQPQPQPWQAPPMAWSAPYRSPRALGITASVLLGVVALFDVLDAAAALAARGQYQELVGEPALSGDVVVNAELVSVVTGMLGMAAMLATGVVFICWFLRVRKNAELLAPQLRQRRSPGWAGWGWFVPVVSIWFPFQIAQDSWRAAAPEGTPKASEKLLGFWWAAWLLSLTVGRVDGQLYVKAETAEAYVTSFGVTAVSDGLELVAAVLAILVVRRLTARQDAAAARLAAAPYWPQV